MLCHPPKIRTGSVSAGYTFPYLFDENQDVAKVTRASAVVHQLSYMPGIVSLAF